MLKSRDVHPAIAGASIIVSALLVAEIARTVAHKLDYDFNPWVLLFVVPVGVWLGDTLRIEFGVAGDATKKTIRRATFVLLLAVTAVAIIAYGVLRVASFRDSYYRYSNSGLIDRVEVMTHGCPFIWLAVAVISVQGAIWYRTRKPSS